MVTVLGFSWITPAIFGVGFQFFFVKCSLFNYVSTCKISKIYHGSVIFSGEGAYVAVLHKLRVN